MFEFGSPKELFYKIKESYIVPGAFQRWSGYREKLTDAIIDFAEPGKPIAIVGSGYSNDINLGRLYKHCKKIALFDRNVEAMERSLVTYDLYNKQNVSVNRCDLFGVSDEEYIDLIEKSMNRIKKLAGTADFAILSGYMNSMIEHVKNQEVRISNDKYDCTIAVGLHSQIISFLAHIWNSFATIGMVGDLSMIDKMVRLNETQIPRINNELIGMTKEKLFVGVEMYNTFLGENKTIHGAVECNHDLNSRIAENELILDGSFEEIWPFSEEKEYRMLFYKMRKA